MVIKMTNSKLDKHPKAKWFLYCLFKVIFVAYLIVFIMWLIINHYAIKPKSIYTKIGNNVAVRIPIKQTIIIKEYAINEFTYYGKQRNFEAQYNMLTDEYKNSITFEQYMELVKDIDWNSFQLEELKAKTDYCFEAYVTYIENGEQVHTTYLLYTTKYNTEKFNISPNKFVYAYTNQTVKNDGVELEISKCVIFMNKVVLNATIKNASLFSKLDVRKINISYNDVMTKKQNIEFSLEPGEEKEIFLEYTGLNYFLPNMVQIEKVKDENTIKVLDFELKEVEN